MMESVEASVSNHVNGWAGALKNYFGLSNTTAMLALIAVIFVAGLVLYYVVRPIILAIVYRISRKDKNKWLRAFYETHVFHRISWLIPGIVIYLATPLVETSTLPLSNALSAAMYVGIEIYSVAIIAAAMSAMLSAVELRFRYFHIAKQYNIKSYVQVLRIALFCLTAIVIIAIAIGKSPMYLLTGLGAMTAVILLIFRDSILGFVASIQLSAYDMVRVGDWIEMPKFGADGDVLDISLNTIKIQNFDKTIVTIPSYAILSEGVKNWRGMNDSGGRRIKRYVTLDINTVKLCTPELFDRLAQLPLLKEKLDSYLQSDVRYIDPKAIELLGGDQRGVTNLAMFRYYLEVFLKSHPKISKDMSFLIRELQNTGYGLPLEMYIFTNITDWGIYESIQAEIFDYIYAIMPLFELEAYQMQAETHSGYAKGIT